MKKMTKSVIAAAVLAATSTAAMAEVSMSVGVTSNYLFRGISASGDNAAVSGSIDYSHESGLYAGIWASTLDTGVGEEVDFILGYGGSAGDFGYDVSLVNITYPQQKDWDYTELALSGSYSYFTAGVAATIASDVDDVALTAEQFIEDDMYYYVSADIPLKDDFSLGLLAGNYTFEDDGVAGAKFDYKHYQIALTKSAGDYGDVTFAYDSTDIDDDPTTAYEEDAAHFTVSWSKTF